MYLTVFILCNVLNIYQTTVKQQNTVGGLFTWLLKYFFLDQNLQCSPDKYIIQYFYTKLGFCNMLIEG